MTAALTPADLRRIGEAMHGPEWQTPLARDLGISPRAMRYYAAGERAFPSKHLPKLRALVSASLVEARERVRVLRMIEREMGRWGAHAVSFR